MGRQILLLRRPSGGSVPTDDPLEDTDYRGFLYQEAPRRGIDPRTAEVVANSEGGLTEPARMGDFSGPPWYSGKSWWAYQLHYGGRGPAAWQDYSDWGSTSGMGNSFTYSTLWHPGDPRAWRDAMRYALDGARANGWGAWYGAAVNGIYGFDGIDRTVPWAGTPPQEWDYPAWTAASASS